MFAVKNSDILTPTSTAVLREKKKKKKLGKRIFLPRYKTAAQVKCANKPFITNFFINIRQQT